LPSPLPSRSRPIVVPGSGHSGNNEVLPSQRISSRTLDLVPGPRESRPTLAPKPWRDLTAVWQERARHDARSAQSMPMSNINPDCDGTHCRPGYKEVRLYPRVRSHARLCHQRLCRRRSALRAAARLTFVFPFCQFVDDLVRDESRKPGRRPNRVSMRLLIASLLGQAGRPASCPRSISPARRSRRCSRRSSR
jgi:hypothetical protein